MTGRLEKFLGQHKRVGIATNSFIYLIEEHPKYFRSVEPFFEAVRTGRTQGVTATLSMMEILVQPYRRGLADLANEFYALLHTYPHLEWRPLTLEIADHASQIRAKYNLKTPDAIHIATALNARATGFISNDRHLKRVQEIEFLIIGELA